jgi:zinc transport system ATP-binding protein
MNNLSAVVSIENLWFAYDKEIALQDINLRLEPATFLGIIGPNGAGKTTLIKIVLGLLKPTRGQVRVFDSLPTRNGERIGYVPQHSLQDMAFPITTLEVVLMGRLSGKKIGRSYTKEDVNAALRALETVEMLELKSKQISELSGGQKQRVLLARALSSNPGLLILDEPLSGIDICLEFAFYELLKKLKEKMAIILISHDIGVVSQHVDKIACLNKQLVYHDDKEEVLKNLERVYGCPVDIIAHGVPHRILKDH